MSTPIALSALVVVSLLGSAADAREQMDHQESPLTGVLPLKLETPIPLAVRSPGVEWGGKTFHLITLASIQFGLNKTNRLTADLRAQVTSFDNVDYDISSAVFDDAGQLLGTARVQSKVERLWVGRVMHSARNITMDFGVSLDYPRATSFMISVSKRKVLTPDDWQK